MNAFPRIDMVATGANIKKIRISCGLSVKDLQEYFGFEQPQAIYKWQWGECLPSIDNLYALSKLFRIPIDQILVGSNEDLNLYGYLVTTINLPCISIPPGLRCKLGNRSIFLPVP
ncbi:MAG: helix-turn-helix transcriptional regulator [Clostridiales bacterium]|nr:helix-turn-helix transcriptional regulator [Clostridiales bacterium]